MAFRTRVSRQSDLIRFYELLGQLEQALGGNRTLGSLSDYRDWSRRGVYFFFDATERRHESGSGPRVVRVGTHALKVRSKSTLRGRLAQHRGNLSGGGNHRGSIFRLLVGQALLQRGDIHSCDSWGFKSDKGSAARVLNITMEELKTSEEPVEAAVSMYLSPLPFLWLPVEDEPSGDSLRAFIETNAIALLSNYSRPVLDAASEGWLGHCSNRELVRRSGLWNQRHVAAEHNPAFLNLMETLISNIGAPDEVF